MYDMQHHQGARASGQALAGPVPLYPYSGIGMEMQGIGMDMGEAVSLYPYSGLGMDLGGILDQAQDWFEGLSPLIKAGVAAVGVYAAFMLWKKRSSIKAKLGLGKARRNGSKRRKARRSRRNGGHAAYAAPAKARTNRRKARRTRKAGSRRNTRHSMPARNAKGRFLKARSNGRRGASRRRRSR